MTKAKWEMVREDARQARIDAQRLEDEADQMEEEFKRERAHIIAEPTRDTLRAYRDEHDERSNGRCYCPLCLRVGTILRNLP